LRLVCANAPSYPIPAIKQHKSARHGRVYVFVYGPSFRVQKLSQADRHRLGRAVLQSRIRLNLTQEQLAERASIDRRFIQKIEAGELGTSLAVLKRLRKALRLTWDGLLEGI
jgi:DNA-binding XRE family transcriptional regulator